jgi:ankyrin repeat protein
MKNVNLSRLFYMAKRPICFLGWLWMSVSLPVSAQDTTDTTSLNFQLLYAAREGKVEKIVRLLNQGADINTTSWGGVTPLMYAVDGGYYEAVQALVLNGADVNLVPDNKITSLFSAVYGNQPAIADLLLQHGAFTDINDDKFVTPLMVAVSYGYVEITDLLLYYGANTERKDSQGNTSLILAALTGNTQIADMLLSAGAGIQARDNQGFTPLMSAAQTGDTSMISLLLTHGAELNTTNTAGYTALAIAVINDNKAAVSLLLDKGADPNGGAEELQSISQLARTSGKKDIMVLIKQHGGKEKFKPDLTLLPLGIIQSFNLQDYYTGFFLGTQERRTKLSLEIGFMARPTSKRILIDAGVPHVYYQFREYRYIAFLKTEKIIPLVSTGKRFSLAATASLAGMFTWGDYRGSSMTPLEKVMLVPQVGLGLYKKVFGVNAAYERMPMNIYKTRNGRMNVGLTWYISTMPERMKTKQVAWW